MYLEGFGWGQYTWMRGAMVGHRGETGGAYHCYTLCAGFLDDSAGGRRPSVAVAGRWLCLWIIRRAGVRRVPHAECVNKELNTWLGSGACLVEVQYCLSCVDQVSGRACVWGLLGGREVLFAALLAMLI